ncbi:MAG TPA: hypothetical protein VMF89_06420, partial [Polyangiales bacterium]|nr:hypothetical protein [Polyangiales bacterium]
EQNEPSDMRALYVSWIVAVAVSCSTVYAEDAARDVAGFQADVDAGLAAYQAGRYGEARKSFARAHAARQSSRTFRALGITDFALDDFASAHQELSAALTDPREPIPAEQRQEVQALLTWMHDKLAHLQLARTPRNAEVFVDDARTETDEVWVAPGEHHIRATASDHIAYNRMLNLTAGAEAHSLAIVLQPKTSRVAAASDTWLWVGGASVLALAAGGTLFGLGRLQIDEVEQPGPPFRQASDAEAQQLRGQWLTGLGIGIGSAGLVGIATALVLRVRDDRERSTLHVSIAPTHVTVRGSF